MLRRLGADMPEAPRDRSSHFAGMAALVDAVPASSRGPAPTGGTASYATAQAPEAEAAPYDGRAVEQARGGEASVALPAKDPARIPSLDDGHVAMTVALDACIQCGPCVRACREVQVDGVIGMSGRGADAHPTFDFADPMGESACVACGKCVQACPTGALLEAPVAALADSDAHDAETKTVCPFCGVGCQVSLKTEGTASSPPTRSTGSTGRRTRDRSA